MQVKCITLRPFDGIFSGGCKIVEGGVYTVVDEQADRRSHRFFELSEDIGTLYAVEMFVPYNPYSSSVSKELAEKACEPVIEIDQPLKKMKELETQN